MHDGAIVFNTRIDNSDVEKDLKATEKKIRNAEDSIYKNENAKMPLVKQAEQLDAKLKDAKQNLAYIRQEMAAVQAAMAPGVSADDYMAASADYERIKAALDAQEKEVDDLQKQWKKVNDKVEEYDLKIQRSREEIEKETAEVGRLRAKLGRGGNSLSAVFDNADKSASRFKRRLIGIGMSAFVFNVLSAGLRNAVGYMGKILNTNKQYTQQLAKLRTALLAAFQPIYEFVLPGLLMVMKVLTAILTLFGKFLSWLMGKSYSDMVKSSQALYKEASAIEAVGNAAKKAQKSLAGFDELNRLGENDSDLDYDLGGLTGSGIGEMGELDTSDLDMESADLSGMMNLLDGLGIISALLGKFKFAGILNGIEGIKEIIEAIRQISVEGFSVEAISNAISGIGNIIAAIGFFIGNLKLAGIGMVIDHVGDIIEELAANWEQIKQGDWSGVDKAGMIVDVIGAIAGVVVAMGVFNVISKVKNFLAAGKAIKDITTQSGNVFGGLKNLAVKFAWGVLIIAEVAAAAVLVAGAIALLGYELQLVGDAWTPVIENGETVVAAMAAGIAILAGVGAAAYLLGTVGKTAAVNIGIGTAILLEIGAAAGLFIAEIWAIGTGLDAIGTAWEPVISNGGSIAKAIGVGTGALAAIGVAAAALGAVTVASAGTLPAAIAIGTAVLVELGASFILFSESLSGVADSLSNRLHPALSKANGVLPSVSTNMENFVGFMGDFAEQVAAYTSASVITSLNSGIDKIVNMFAGDPIGNMAAEIESMHGQLIMLNAKLTLIIPELQLACTMMSDFHALVGQLNSLLGIDITLSDSMHINMMDVGINQVAGLAEGMMAGQPLLLESMTLMVLTIQEGFVLPSQTILLTFFAWTSTMFTTNSAMVAAAFAMDYASLNGMFIAPSNAAFTALFAMLTAGWNANSALIISTFQTGYATGVSAGFVTPTQALITSMNANLRAQFTSLQNLTISSFRAAAAGARSAFSGLASWFSSNVYGPISAQLASLRSQISSVMAAANAAAARVSSLSTFRGGFAKGGSLRSGWALVGEAGPEILQMVGGKAVITPLNIPYLAQGAVLPANKPFMAMVGDQKHGTNVEAPLEIIQQAVAEVMGDQAAAMLAGFEAVVQAIQEKNLSVLIGDSDIGEANARYSRRMAIRRGG